MPLWMIVRLHKAFGIRKGWRLVVAICFCLMPLTVGLQTARAASWSYMPYPNGPVVVVNPFDEGDETDLLIEALAPVFFERTGQSISTRSMPGRAGATAWGWLSGQTGDGYQLAVSVFPNLLLRSLDKYPVYHLGDLRVFCLFAEMPLALWVPQDSPYQTVGDLVDEARARPGTIVLAGSGSESAAHMATLQLNRQTGTLMLYVPYTGNSTGMAAVRKGLAQAVWGFASADFAEKHKARALAVAAPERLASLPDVPIFAESKVDLILSGEFGLVTPANTPPKTMQDMAGVFYTLATDPKAQGRLMLYGFVPKPLNAAPLWEKMQGELAKMEDFRRMYSLD